MKENEKTLVHLRQFRLLIEENIHIERVFREHLKKKKPVDLDELLSNSVSYQRFLERMLEDVFQDITL